MIHKIERIATIGKFHDYNAAGNVTFGKLTLLYADNGIGKTTLTSIIRSLTIGDVSIITRRKTTGLNTPQAARIVQRSGGTDTTHTFRTAGWSNPFPNIEIFDTHFVGENVFSGFSFTDDHKKQLYQFVIGAQGVVIQRQIEVNKRLKATARQTIDALENQIVAQVGNGLTRETLNAFLPLQQNNNIALAIADAETNLTNARANNVIQALRTLVPLQTVHSRIDFESIITDLQKTSDTIKDAVLEKLFIDHCTDLNGHTLTSPENWLRSGFRYVQAKSNAGEELECPFCKQGIETTTDIFTAYTQKFNDELNELIDRLQRHAESINSFNLEAALQGIQTAIQGNSDSINTWAAHLPNNTPAPATVVIPDIETIREEFNSVIEAVRQKQVNPTIAVDPVSLQTFQATGQTLNQNIQAYNIETQQYNTAIGLFRAGIQGIPQAQSEVDRLNRLERRFDPGIAALCIQLQTEKQSLRTLDAAYPGLVAQQEAAATVFFNSYRDRINHYLNTVFKTPFRIDDVQHVSPQGRAIQSRIAYNLTINGQPISFNPEDNHNTKDSLSDGDKSTLALAFFLAKLDIDPHKADKIIVFDDPLSSFDRNRRQYTIRILTELLATTKQVVVLSHNENFLHDISKGVAPADKNILHISENFVTKASSIIPLNLERLVQLDYFKHLEELQDFLHHTDITRKEEILGKIRNVLESCLRFKFYRQIPANQNTLGSVITVIENAGVPFRDHNSNDVITTLRMLNGVSLKPHHGEPAPNYNILGVNPDTMTVAELANLVQDTLDMIDTRI